MTVQKIKGQIDICEIKRLHADIVIQAKCPVCKADVECDLNETYLSYLKVPSDDWLPFYCDKCDEYLDLSIKINRADLVIEYDADRIKVQ